MPDSIFDQAVEKLLARPGQLTASPADWRDKWIYFLLVDRFNNPAAPPPFEEPCGVYQGGTFAGIKAQLKYIKNLGVGAIWLSPVQNEPAMVQGLLGRIRSVRPSQH